MNEKSLITSNKKAFHNYEIFEKIEVGIALKGCEVKSIRARKATIKESFARVIDNELWLINCHINPYKEGNRFNPNPTRDRKLLAHKREIKKLSGKINEKGFTLVPLNLYLLKNKVKIQIGIAKAKKIHDKRHSLKEKDTKREIDRGMSARY
ncbi:MAG: SsrA-binding protein SmpB [bacterium]|nr:SsrA-binding protein SmpB [bacterium]